jgi:hypothetical protein
MGEQLAQELLWLASIVGNTKEVPTDQVKKNKWYQQKREKSNRHKKGYRERHFLFFLGISPMGRT